MKITMRYGADLNVGADQFDDLDVDATNAAYVAIVAQQLQAAYPDAEVDVSYDRHANDQSLDVEDGDEGEVKDALMDIENRAAGGDFGEYAVKVSQSTEK